MGIGPSIPILLLGLALLPGCTPRLLRQAEPAELHTGILAFLADGKTTREEVLLRLGTPNARFEGERVLTYAYLRRSDGGWVRWARTWNGERDGFVYQGNAPVHNLVLAFGPEGRLARHSLVLSQ